MKKALLAVLCFILVSLALVNSAFALPDFDKVFQVISELFEDGIPEIGGEGTAVDVALVSDDKPQNLYPGSEVSRTFQVQNLGKGNVYFRLVYAIQYDAESWDNLTISFDADKTAYDESQWLPIEIGTTPYKMKVFTYTNALPIATNSPEVSMSIAMDTTVTSEQVARYRSDFLHTQVLAIGADDFKYENGEPRSAQDALDMALPIGENFNPF